MISLAFLSDIITIFFYDRTKKDWFGIEIAKDIQDSISSKSVAAVLKWTRNSGDLVTAVALSFLIDPLLIMLYMRHGSNQYNWISKRDWKIFLTATVVGNVYWATLVYLGIESVEYIAG